jgi:ketosteroid isomerase-like protein
MAQVASPDIRATFAEGLECWNEGEVDLMLDHYDPSVTADFSRVLPDESVLHGLEAIRPYFHRMLNAWERLRFDPEEVFDLGQGRYLVATRVQGRGRSSGIEVDQRQGFLYTLSPSNKKVVSLVVYPSPDEGLADT